MRKRVKKMREKCCKCLTQIRQEASGEKLPISFIDVYREREREDNPSKLKSSTLIAHCFIKQNQTYRALRSCNLCHPSRCDVISGWWMCLELERYRSQCLQNANLKPQSWQPTICCYYCCCCSPTALPGRPSPRTLGFNHKLSETSVSQGLIIIVKHHLFLFTLDESMSSHWA